jgi:K+-sensing histidine kinase KdpD
MKRVRKRGTGRRAQLAKRGASKAKSSKTVRTKTGAAKTRLLKARAPQVTAKASVNKASVNKAAVDKARGKVPRGSGVLAPAEGVVEAALAVFAHEVRTPLTGILAISDLLATSELGERERRWVDTIKAGAEHLSSLATLFVDAAKDETSGTVPRQDLFDLRVLARAAGDSLAGRAAAKGLQADVEISSRLPGLVIGDPVRMAGSRSRSGQLTASAASAARAERLPLPSRCRTAASG